MAQSEEFRRLLTEGIYRVSAYEAGKPIRVVQDELGYALGKRGGSALEYWRQGHLPKTHDIERLARLLIQRSDLDAAWLAQFLTSAAYPHPSALGQALFPNEVALTTPGPARVPPVYLLPNKAYRVLLGRELLVDDGLAALQDSQGRWIVAIDGIGGIGKTALARELVARSEEMGLFDAIIWLSAAGRAAGVIPPTADALTFATLLDTVARHLGTLDMSRAEQAEKIMRVQMLLRRQRVLLVLDNLETASEPQAALIAHLQPLLNPSKMLCTSRQRFMGDVYAIHLGGLTPAAATQLIQQAAQERRVLRLTAADPALIAQIVTTTGGSPLALKLVVGQAHHLPLPAVLQALGAARPLHAWPDEETALYQALFWPAWALLSTPARKLLVALALFVPGEGGNLAALQAVSNLPETPLLASLDELWRLSLLEVEEGTIAGPLRYFLHSLTHQFALQFSTGEPNATRAEVNLEQWQDQPLDAAYPAYFQDCLARALGYLRQQIEIYATIPPPAPERRLAMHVLNEALALPTLWPQTSKLLIQLAPKMEQAGHRRDWLPYLARSIDLGQQVADQRATAELQLKAGMLYQLLGEYASAVDQLSASAAGFQALADNHNQARALNRWAYVMRLQRDAAAATGLAQTAAALLSAEEAERGSSYTVLGAVALDAHDWSLAAAYFRQSLLLWQPTGNSAMIARRLRDLGSALRAQAHYREAIACYEQAIARFAEGQEPSQQAVTQMNLGNVYTELGQPTEAIELYQLAEPRFQQTYDEPQLAILYNNRGEAYAHLHQLEQAKAAYLTSLAYRKHSADQVTQVQIMDQLGLIYAELQQPVEAVYIWQKALTILAQINGERDYSELVENVTNHLQTGGV